MHGVDEKLGSARIRGARVGHGQSKWLVGNLGAVRVATELVGDVSAGVASDGFAVGQSVGRAPLGSASAGALAVGVLAVGAAELVHEVGNDTVEMEAVVVSE